MSFASAAFLILFAAMLLSQLTVRPPRARQWILLAGSYVFLRLVGLAVLLF